MQSQMDSLKITSNSYHSD